MLNREEATEIMFAERIIADEDDTQTSESSEGESAGGDTPETKGIMNEMTNRDRFSEDSEY